MNDSGAFVLFSGGHDSTTSLAWELARFEVVKKGGFDYGQRHRVELECRSDLRGEFALLRPEWRRTIAIAALGDIADTALTRETKIKLSEFGDERRRWNSLQNVPSDIRRIVALPRR